MMTISQQTFSRALLHQHHLLSQIKIRAISKWKPSVSSTTFGGVYKTGHPGLVICWGAHDDVKAYVRMIKSMRWQTCELRSLEDISEAEMKETTKNVELVQSLGEAGAVMDKLGWKDWWRRKMHYTKDDP